MRDKIGFLATHEGSSLRPSSLMEPVVDSCSSASATNRFDSDLSYSQIHQVGKFGIFRKIKEISSDIEKIEDVSQKNLRMLKVTIKNLRQFDFFFVFC